MVTRQRDVKLPFLHVYKDRHGKARSAYRRVEKRGGPRISVPIKGDVGSPGWHKHYNEIHAGFEGEKKKKPKSPDTISDLLPRWLATLTDKSESTRINYRSIAKKLDKWAGDQKVTTFRRRDVYDFRDALAEFETPSVAERCIVVLSLLFQYAMERGLRDDNPAEKIRKPIGFKPEPYRPWSDDEIDTVLNGAPEHIVRCVMVLLYTGLRVSDAIQLQWQNISDDGYITIKTQKTGADVCIPIAAELAEELAKPKRGMFLLLSKTGRQYQRTICSTDIRKTMRKLGLDPVPPVHGLRKNSVMKLIEDGNDYDIIHAITGQSKDMIAHYGQAFDRKKLASRAVLKPRFGKYN